MNDWLSIQIKELGNVITGNTPPRANPEYYGNHTLFVKPTDIDYDTKYTYVTEEDYSELGFEKYRNSLIPKDATCVVTIGAIGRKITKAHCDLFINQAMNAVIPSAKYDADFVYYLLKFNVVKLKTLDSGTASGRENVSKSSFSNMRVSVPSLPTQKKIAKILSNYDDLIENNLKRIKLLEESARLTYKEWFLRFKIDGEKLEVNSETGLPLGWKFKELANFVSFKKGKKVEELFENDAPGLTKLLLLKSLSSQAYEYVKQERQVIAERNDILMLMDGARSSAVFYAVNGAVGSTLALMKIKNIPKSYVYHYLDARYKWLEINNTGAAIPHANKSFINKMKILIPSEDIFNSWDDKIKKINNEVYNLKDQNKLLKESRDILLPRLMTGMIDVEDMEVIL